MTVKRTDKQKSNQSDQNNYRGISLLPLKYKIYSLKHAKVRQKSGSKIVNSYRKQTDKDSEKVDWLLNKSSILYKKNNTTPNRTLGTTKVITMLDYKKA